MIYLTLEQHRFELHGSTYMWSFFSKYLYVQMYFLFLNDFLNNIFFSLLEDYNI